ncbi:MAG: IS66 family transposase [Nitrosotalea sp.]
MKQEEEIILLRRENAELRKEVESLRAEILVLKGVIEELRGKMNKDSKNSSKPPSTDIRRTKSLRISSGKPRGGQHGHAGSTLSMSRTPDKIVRHRVTMCKGCGRDISIFQTHRYDRRQVYDIPPLRMCVTEHQAEKKRCIHCQTENIADFPEAVSQPVGYGNHIKQLGVYLTQYQLLPYGRSAELIEDLTGHQISTGSLVNFTEECSGQLPDFIKALKEHLKESKVVHSDETGFRYEGKRQWLHVATTKDSTFYMAHEKRGTEAMDAMGILQDYRGVNVHDYWKSYLAYGCKHALCNAHHLRDLTFCYEQEKSSWAGKMIKLLLEMKSKVEEAKELHQTCLKTADYSSLSEKYEGLIKEGYSCHPIAKKPPGKRGRVKKTKTQNLLIRFDEHQEDILRFMNDFKVPFDNNLAERAIRMMRLKQKISGCFRSKQGAETFATIRSYIDTLRKNGVDIMEALALAINGKPYMTSPSSYPQLE